MKSPCALIMAGGTGGHIFPGLAVAVALREHGWRVHWLGGSGPTMESTLVPQHGFDLTCITFAGLRGKGLMALALLPLRLLRALWQSMQALHRIKPDVVLGLGGYITFPAGLMSVLLGKPLLLHEQNAIAGLVNKVLAHVATGVYSTFPNALPRAQWIGNPLRATFTCQADPHTRFAGRTGPLKLLVLGGSLGAKALNELVPQALALLPAEQRPQVTAQSGNAHIEALRANYAAAGVQAELTPFIADTAQAMAQADLIICRAGASTVSELAAVGAAAVLVPFPFAVDDHQTHNAQFLASQGAAWLMPQRELDPQALANLLLKMERSILLQKALAAKTMQKTEAVVQLLAACQALGGTR